MSGLVRFRRARDAARSAAVDDRGMDAAKSTKPGIARVIIVGGAAVWLASLVLLLIVNPHGITMSSDPGAAATPIWAVLLPVAVGIALALLLAPPRDRSTVDVADSGRLRASTVALAVSGLAFIVVASIPTVGADGWYPLAKAVLLVAIPAVIVAVLRPAVRIRPRSGARRWWAPFSVIVAWVLLAEVAPWNPGYDITGIPVDVLIVVALVTALTAGVGEELFFRRWLQTRLEAIVGSWAGVVLASAFFALMHIGTHRGPDGLLVDLATVVIAQGSMGMLFGILWWRYRNLTVIITLHILVNGWAVAVALLS